MCVCEYACTCTCVRAHVCRAAGAGVHVCRAAGAGAGAGAKAGAGAGPYPLIHPPTKLYFRQSEATPETQINKY